MRRADVHAVLREIRDLREDLVIAVAEQVKMQRIMRAVVTDPRNREMVFRHFTRPSYLSPGDVLRDLEEMRRLSYLILPGRKNRIKPDVLLGRYQVRDAAVQDLAARLEALEEGARQAGIGLDVLPGEMTRQAAAEEAGAAAATGEPLDSLWNLVPDSPAAVRTRNALMRGGYATVPALMCASEEDLMDIRNFGDACLTEVRRVLDFHGIALAGEY